jgi:nickel-dependent lactate racemase
MNLTLRYGRSELEFVFPEHTAIPVYSEPEYAIDKNAFTGRLEELLPTDPQKYRNVAIVVSDKTRLCGYPEFLPWVVDSLQGRGAGKDNITFYIAYGTHAKQSEEESRNAYGPVYGQYRFVQHDCRDESAFDVLGNTGRGTPVTIRKDIRASSLVITFGAISHHYFAGYGGGRKLLFPGLAERKAVYHNHSLFLDRQARSLAAGCQPGQLDGNPLAEDLREVETHMPERISVHGILNASGKVCKLMVGNSQEDFLEACRTHDSYYRYGKAEQFDLVIASSGGYPKDINFIQAHKSVHHAAAFVKDGGRLVMLSECIDKIGSDYFLKFLEAGSFEAAFAMLENKYEGNGGTALSMMQKAKRIHISMLTTLGERECTLLGVKKIKASEITPMIAEESGSIAVIRNASMLVK